MRQFFLRITLLIILCPKAISASGKWSNKQVEFTLILHGMELARKVQSKEESLNCGLFCFVCSTSLSVRVQLIQYLASLVYVFFKQKICFHLFLSILLCGLDALIFWSMLQSFSREPSFHSRMKYSPAAFAKLCSYPEYISSTTYYS